MGNMDIYLLKMSHVIWELSLYFHCIILLLFHQIIIFLPGGSDGIDESTDDLFEEKLIEAIDGISQKSSQGRAQCLDSVSVAFSKRYLPDFAVDRSAVY